MVCGVFLMARGGFFHSLFCLLSCVVVIGSFSLMFIIPLCDYSIRYSFILLLIVI